MTFTVSVMGEGNYRMFTFKVTWSLRDDGDRSLGSKISFGLDDVLPSGTRLCSQGSWQDLCSI